MRKLFLEDGSVYAGAPFGAKKDVVCEVVFNTSMAGYQEIVSDPSYTDQGVVMSYPLIGNYGITDEDFESKLIAPSAFIVRDYNDQPSNFRYTKTLSELLEEAGIPGITGIDTRKLVRNIRDTGAKRAFITDEDISVDEAVDMIKSKPVPHDQVKRVSCKKRWYARTANPVFSVVAIDCGMKQNIVRSLCAHGCNVTVVPYDTAPEGIVNMKPDGVFISNGP
ncbi:MAG: carbamoyl phosphate synthase small subunit, partial [Eubacterium sp.]|nr:carbamoyl phosphate synthase small subunit [Eubacterium sp.]